MSRRGHRVSVVCAILELHSVKYNSGTSCFPRGSHDWVIVNRFRSTMYEIEGYCALSHNAHQPLFCLIKHSFTPTAWNCVRKQRSPFALMAAGAMWKGSVTTVLFLFCSQHLIISVPRRLTWLNEWVIFIADHSGHISLLISLAAWGSTWLKSFIGWTLTFYAPLFWKSKKWIYKLD